VAVPLVGGRVAFVVTVKAHCLSSCSSKIQSYHGLTALRYVQYMQEQLAQTAKSTTKGRLLTTRMLFAFLHARSTVEVLS